ncbi:MAG: CsbD family protein [Proteobacteria bacterium]|nr:CsbD family protein [Pseudomonadota bacterium]
MNKDQVKGRIKEAEGKMKEVAGKVVGNEKLEAEGKVQKIVGKVQANYGDLKEDVKDELKKSD